MSEFQDAKGRTWSVALDFETLRQIKCVNRVDLGAVERLAETWAKLLSDDDLALSVLWTVLISAAKVAGVSQSDWLGAMNGETLDAAVKALGDSIRSFTRPLKRGLAETAIGKIQAGYAEAIAKAEQRLAAEVGKATTRALGRLAPSAPESLDTFRRNGHSAKRSKR